MEGWSGQEPGTPAPDRELKAVVLLEMPKTRTWLPLVLFMKEMASSDFNIEWPLACPSQA